MRGILILAIGAIAMSGTASASLIERTTGLHYQHDGGLPSDAPDVCEQLDPNRVLAIDGKSSKGMLVPADDESDFFNTPTGGDLVGERVFVRIRGADANLARLDLDVQLPGCAGSVFDPATYDMQREMLMSHPKYNETEAPGPGQKTALVKSLTGYTCDPTAWHFVINQIADKVVPGHIRVKWSNGVIENIPAVKTTPATVAHYVSTSNLDQPVWSASVNIFESWSGRFNLGSGPCNGEPTPPPDPYVPPIDNGASGYFTVVSPLSYATQARYVDPVKGSMQMSCHEACGGLVDAMGLAFGYDLAGSLAPS